MSPRVSASSIAAASVIRVRGESSIGSPTANASITSLTGVGSAPIRDSIRSTRPGGMIGSPIHRQYPFRCTIRPPATSCSTSSYSNASRVERSYFQRVLSSHNAIDRFPAELLPVSMEDLDLQQVYRFCFLATTCKRQNPGPVRDLSRAGISGRLP